MTTPDGQPAPGPATAAPPPVDRVTRPEPARAGPDRSRSALPPPPVPPTPGFAPGADNAAPSTRDGNELEINNAVASSVKSAYDVLAETIEQGRRSAEHFREGAYNVRDVPEDVRTLASNLLNLARQLSNNTFDICDALLRQIPVPAAPLPPGSTAVPPFQPVKPIGAAAGPLPATGPAAPQPAPAPGMRLSVRFVGTDTAIAHTATLARPTVPTAPSDVTSAALAPRAGDAPPITGVTFAADLADGGLIATVTVPPGQPTGTYAGAVYSAGQPLPLGLLVVELAGG